MSGVWAKFTGQWSEGPVGQAAMILEVIGLITFINGLLSFVSFSVWGIIIGLLTMVVGVLGMKGAWDRNPVQLFYYSAVMVLLIALSIVGIIVGIGAGINAGLVVLSGLWNILCYGCAAYLAQFIKNGGQKPTVKTLKVAPGAEGDVEAGKSKKSKPAPAAEASSK